VIGVKPKFKVTTIIYKTQTNILTLYLTILVTGTMTTTLRQNHRTSPFQLSDQATLTLQPGKHKKASTSHPAPANFNKLIYSNNKPTDSLFY